jgi:hypothetical protein
MSRNIIIIFLAALTLQGCTVLGDLLPPEASSVEVVTTAPAELSYIAPTLPPEYTLTPTVTITPTSPPSPTPFQVVTLEITDEPDEDVTPTATTVQFVGQWELYESRRLGASIRVPTELSAYDYGQSIRVGDPDILSGNSLLFLEILFDQANSYRLPDGIDATNPRNVLEAVIRELEGDFTEFQLVRAIQDVDFNGIGASEVAARASLVTGTSEVNINWYLAVAIRDETVVRIYGSSPASAGVTFITIAERIADSFNFID